MMNEFFIALMLLTGLLAIAFGVFGVMAKRIDAQALQQCPPQAPLILHAGVHWHMLDIGLNRSSDITVLLVHGIGGNMRHFQAGMALHEQGLQAALAQTHRVIAVDRPGSGYSRIEGGRGHLSLLAQAHALHTLLDHQGVGRVLIVGHSLGGAIALAMAQQRPDRVAGLALLAPLTAAMTQAPAMFAPLALVPRVLASFLSHTLLPLVAKLMQSNSLRDIFYPVRVPESFAVQGGGYLSGRPSQLLAIMLDMLAALQDMPCIQARCASMKLPVHVLYDPADKVLSAKQQGQTLPQRLPSAKVEFMDNAGHMLPITQTECCANWLRHVLHTLDFQDPRLTP